MERRPHIAWTVSAICVLATGCDTELRTENRQVRLKAHVHSYDSLGSGHGIVEQSTVCVERTGYRTSPDDPYEFTDAEDEPLRACYDERLTGPATFDEVGCVVLDTPGDVTWDFVRKPCDLPDHFADDRVLFEVLPLTATRGAFTHAIPPWTAVLGMEVEAPEGIPEGYVSEVGEPMRAIEDTLDAIPTAVVRGDRPELVAVTEPTVTAQPIAGSPSFRIDDDPSTTLHVDAVAGDAFQVGLALPAGEVDVGRVDVVPRSEVAAMTLHPFVLRVVDTDIFLQLGATAITRDRDGRVLRGAPVEWRVLEGDLALSYSDVDEDGVPDPGPDASIEGACADAAPGETRSVLLEGRLDGFRDTVRVEWDCVGEAAQEGCACRSGRAGERAWLGPMVLLLLGLWHRRRGRRRR